MNFEQEFEKMGYSAWINSDLYPNGKTPTQEYVAWLEKRLRAALAAPGAFTPPWAEAPEGANWVAQDSDGAWWWYKDRPIKGWRQWLNYGPVSFAMVGERNIKWRETLQQKPKEKTQ